MPVLMSKDRSAVVILLYYSYFEIIRLDLTDHLLAGIIEPEGSSLPGVSTSCQSIIGADLEGAHGARALPLRWLKFEYFCMF